MNKDSILRYNTFARNELAILISELTNIEIQVVNEFESNIINIKEGEYTIRIKECKKKLPSGLGSFYIDLETNYSLLSVLLFFSNRTMICCNNSSVVGFGSSTTSGAASSTTSASFCLPFFNFPSKPVFAFSAFSLNVLNALIMINKQ